MFQPFFTRHAKVSIQDFPTFFLERGGNILCFIDIRDKFINIIPKCNLAKSSFHIVPCLMVARQCVMQQNPRKCVFFYNKYSNYSFNQPSLDIQRTEVSKIFIILKEYWCAEHAFIFSKKYFDNIVNKVGVVLLLWKFLQLNLKMILKYMTREGYCLTEYYYCSIVRVKFRRWQSWK